LLSYGLRFVLPAVFVCCLVLSVLRGICVDGYRGYKHFVHIPQKDR
jgi:hypothetical protein